MRASPLLFSCSVTHVHAIKFTNFWQSQNDNLNLTEMFSLNRLNRQHRTNTHRGANEDTRIRPKIQNIWSQRRRLAFHSISLINYEKTELARGSRKELNHKRITRSICHFRVFHILFVKTKKTKKKKERKTTKRIQTG